MDLNQYQQFVASVTSRESNECNVLMNRLYELEQQSDEWNVSLALTASLGMSAETGEFTEIIKKVVFQGKEFNADVKFHLKRELGDILWYWVNACRALGYAPDDVLAENVTKLQARYPAGHFDAFFSENRQPNDL